MGRITTKLSSSPDPEATPFDSKTNVEAEQNENKRTRDRTKAFVAKFVTELVDRGFTAPSKDPKDMTRGEIEAYLQSLVGERIKAEISNDPLELGYAGKSNEEIAEMLNEPLVMSGRKLAGSRVMEVMAPIDSQIITLSRASGQALDLRPLGANLAGKILRIDKPGKGARIALRGVSSEVPEGRQEGIIAGNLTNKVELTAPLATPPEVGDIVAIIDNDTSLLSCRIHQITLGIPFAPNAVTGDDVASARQ